MERAREVREKFLRVLADPFAPSHETHWRRKPGCPQYPPI